MGNTANTRSHAGQARMLRWLEEEKGNTAVDLY